MIPNSNFSQCLGGGGGCCTIHSCCLFPVDIQQYSLLFVISCGTVLFQEMNLVENIKILLADDDEDDQLFFRQALVDSGLGAELTVLSDGEKLIAYMQNLADARAPDVIFLDLNMPGTDGNTVYGRFAETKFSLIY